MVVFVRMVVIGVLIGLSVNVLFNVVCFLVFVIMMWMFFVVFSVFVDSVMCGFGVLGVCIG